MANENIGYISRAALLAHLPEKIPIRKSARENAKYPLYLSVPFGPWHMNTPAGQECLLCYGVIEGQEPPVIEPVAPPVAKVAPVDQVAANDAVEPVAANDEAHTPAAKKAAGFWEFD